LVDLAPFAPVVRVASAVACTPFVADTVVAASSVEFAPGAGWASSVAVVVAVLAVPVELVVEAEAVAFLAAAPPAFAQSWALPRQLSFLPVLAART